MPKQPDSATEKGDSHRTLLRSTLAVSAPTLLSRILGYIRDLIQAYFLGTGHSADAFAFAFIIPNFLRRLTGEGAMTAAFIPVFTRLKNEETKEKIWRFANIFFYDLTVIMVVLTLLGILAAPLIVKAAAWGFGRTPGKIELTVALTRIMFPYMALISLAALAMAVLNSFKKFFVPAFTPVLFNLSIIGAASLLAPRMKEPAFAFALGVVLGGICQLCFQIPFLWRTGMKFRFGLSFTHPAVRKVARLMVPGVFGAGVAQINFALSRVIATTLEEGSVASLYFSSRVHELTLGLYSIALSIALLPLFSDQAARLDFGGMKKTLVFSFKSVFFITMPAMAGLLVLNRPIIQVLFQRGQFDTESTAMTASCLFFFALSLPFVSGVKIMTPAFYAFKDIKTPVLVASVTMAGYIGLSLLFMGPLRVGGIALSFSLSSVFHFFILFVLVEKKIGRMEKKGLFSTSVKSIIAAGIMGLAVFLFIRTFDFSSYDFLGRLVILISAIGVGAAVYFIISFLVNREDLRNVKRMLTVRKRPFNRRKQ